LKKLSHLIIIEAIAGQITNELRHIEILLQNKFELGCERIRFLKRSNNENNIANDDPFQVQLLSQ